MRTATSQAIEVAAIAMFMERGFEAPTAGQIARAAGVSVRTFFRHFPGGKEDVMLLEARRAMQQLKEALESRPPQESALIALRAAVRTLASYDQGHSDDIAVRMFAQIATGHPDLLARMLGERQLLADPLVHLIALRMSTDPARDIRPRLIIHGLHAAMTVTWLTWMSDPSVDMWSLLESALDMLEGGMTAAMAEDPGITGPAPVARPSQRRAPSGESSNSARSATP